MEVKKVRKIHKSRRGRCRRVHLRETDSTGEEALRVLCVEQLRERVWLTDLQRVSLCSEGSVSSALPQ